MYLPFTLGGLVGATRLTYSLVISAFCHELRRDLQQNTDDASQKALENKVESQIQTVATVSLKNSAPTQHQELDAAGTDLWNLCVRLRRQSQHTNENHAGRPAVGTAETSCSRLLTLGRLYAFMILALAQSCAEHNNTTGNLLRLQRLAIKTGKLCLGKQVSSITVLQSLGLRH